MTNRGSRVAIIGAGFSGAVTAANLLRRWRGGPLTVTLINRHGLMARGVAFGTRSSHHVLNVPAARMSAYPDDEDHFLRYARRFDPTVAGGAFLPRRLYGEYLEDLLADAERAAPAQVTLERVVGDVTGVRIQSSAPHVELEYATGHRLQVDRCVLTIGNYAPADLRVADDVFYRSPRYVRDPWAPAALDPVRGGGPVILLGTGLTMLDVALELRTRGVDAPLIAVSRRGLLPQPHRTVTAPPGYEHRPPGITTGPATALAYLRAVRRHVAATAPAGLDWRDVVAGLRPVTAELWQRLPPRERARFLRHLRPYWEVHRHRAAPEIAAAIDRELTAGTLAVRTGRVLGFAPDRNGVTMELRDRTGVRAEVHGTHVVNCTGPNADVAHIADALLASLRAQGLIVPDALRLGAEVAADGALIGRDGAPSRYLYHVGPLARARDWESTAVPELRRHAAAVASAVCAALGEGASADASAGTR